MARPIAPADRHEHHDREDASGTTSRTRRSPRWPPSTTWSSRGSPLSSQRVRPGDVYAALPGARTHGIAFAEAAVEAGAVAVLTDTWAPPAPSDVWILEVDDPRSVLGRLAARGTASRRPR